jgi:hypothetical protein
MNSDTITTTYVLCVRSYWDKPNGNSYFSMRVIGTDGTDKVQPMTYGHGDTTYKHTACIMLGLDWESMDWEERRATFSLDVAEVTRRKDLHKVGN